MSILQFLPVPGNILYFQQSGSFIVPRGISTVVLIACGGGGGYGTGGSGLEGFGGGGAGGLMVGRVFGGQVIPFTIGAGGTSVASGSTGDGGPGGDTTIAGFTLGGGQGGGQDTGGAGGQISGGAESWIIQYALAQGGQGGYVQGGVTYPPAGQVSMDGLAGVYDNGIPAFPWQSVPTGYEYPGTGAAQPGLNGAPGMVIVIY